jgi:O-methyltransferase
MKSLLNMLPRKVKRAIHEHYTRAKGCSYNRDGLITFHHSDFLKDPLFQESYRLGKATRSWGSADIEWRVYVACWAAHKGKSLEGDFVECGVNKGGLSRAVMHYIDFRSLRDRQFYLLDTFCGFPEEYVRLAAQSQIHSYHECYQEVRETFKDFANVHIVRGKVPETLARVSAEKLCYLSLDMNCAEPEVAAAEFFWPRLVSGAVIMLDDYGYSDDYVRQKRAFDTFAQTKGVQVLLLPTGQGLIFKP